MFIYTDTFNKKQIPSFVIYLILLKWKKYHPFTEKKKIHVNYIPQGVYFTF